VPVQQWHSNDLTKTLESMTPIVLDTVLANIGKLSDNELMKR